MQMVRWFSSVACLRHVRSRAWRISAVILAATATFVSFARHDAIGTTRTAVAVDHVQTRTLRSVATTSPATEISVPDPSQLEVRRAYVSGRIDTSLFEDARQAELSDSLILKLVEIFGWDIDFARDITRGDTFAVIYEEKYWMGQKVGDGSILLAEFVNRGHPYRAIGYKDKNGITKYYELDGVTKQKRFLRTPIEFSRISSHYTDRATRFHPILKIWTAHRGIDYAAPAGTPIRATADGRITTTDDIKSLQSNGGYGNAIMIKHDAAYSTLYAHMSRFAPNIRVGSFVEQGQIIGYVGKTGLATGPHLHYEFHVRSVHRDPLLFKFYGTPIPNEERQAYFAQAEPLIAQLQAITDRHLATTR